ncbi:MAG: hydroxyacylglutathione hydrolase [Myxococcales bacterium]|nr:hydroxyacylglutathione hydrolase [Myxococcales bacterium]
MSIVVVPQLSDNFAYLVGTSHGGAAVVDPAQADIITTRCRELGLSLREIWATHHHADHTAGIAALLQQWPNAALRIHEVDWVALSRRDAGCARAIEVEPSRLLLATTGQRFAFGELNVEVIFNPGHTLGAVSYYVHASRAGAGAAVFTGDTLFGAGCGRRFEGTAEVFHASLMALAALPPTTSVYFGHEYTANNLRFALAVEATNTAVAERADATATLRDSGSWSTPSTIALERSTNPFLRCAEPAVARVAMQHAGAAEVTSATSATAVFAALRTWKDTF